LGPVSPRLSRACAPARQAARPSAPATPRRDGAGCGPAATRRGSRLRRPRRSRRSRARATATSGRSRSAAGARLRPRRSGGSRAATSPAHDAAPDRARAPGSERTRFPRRPRTAPRRTPRSARSRRGAPAPAYSRSVLVGTLLERLAEDPGAAGLLLDVDGTLAPIVARPELAAVPEETRTELERLAR